MAFQIMMLLANCKRVGRLVAVLVGLTFTAAWAAPDPKLNLSEAETRWLAAHPVVRIGVDPAYAPYAFIDERGRFRGVAADFTDTIAAMLGIRMERVPLRTWADVLEAAQEQRIDVVTPAVRLPERDVYLNFSRIYIPTPLVIVTRSDSPKIEGPDDLRALAVALVNGYSSTLQVRQRYPDMNVHLVESPLDGLRAVSGGEVDAYVGVLGVSSRLASRHGLTNLQVNAGYEMSENGQRFGVRKDWPELVALLDKALAASPDEDK
ncbi:MAG: transporter substrate-binding domain-containing protein, partial [Pseudorhodoplanes sp.]|nr:transporter substrate-binding domain-containing protein [Pseudorhodoplanes sp.]